MRRKALRKVSRYDRHMRWRPLIRKSAKWGGTVVAVVLLAAWIATIWWGAVRMKQYGVLVVGAGRIEFLYEDLGGPPPTQYDRWRTFGPGCENPGMGRFNWWFDYNAVAPGRSISLPIWSLSVLAALVAVSGWFLDAKARRRARTGACQSCGYSVTGLPTATNCPECGTETKLPA